MEYADLARGNKDKIANGDDSTHLQASMRILKLMCGNLAALVLSIQFYRVVMYIYRSSVT